MKLIVSTFLVYKVKKCLLKSGKVTALGTFVCPGVGTVIGGLVGGVAGGLAGSSVVRGVFSLFK